ncbi:hypothetical protein GCM10028821_07070 [Hymenobacter jeollabukensis]
MFTVYDELDRHMEMPWSQPYGVLKKKQLAAFQAEGIPEVVLLYGRYVNGLRADWQARGGVRLEGSINLLPVERIYGPLDPDEFLVLPEDAPELHHFRPVDMFKPDACVGLLHDERRSPQLYYYDESDRDLEPLDLDLQGYISLLQFTWGFLNWQLLLLELASPAGQARPFRLQPDSLASNTIAWKLPLLAQQIPDWDLDAFVAHYDLVKLSAQPQKPQ